MDNAAWLRLMADEAAGAGNGPMTRGLRKAATEIDRLNREIERMKRGITAIYHHNEACRVVVLEHYRPWWPLSREGDSSNG